MPRQSNLEIFPSQKELVETLDAAPEHRNPTVQEAVLYGFPLEQDEMDGHAAELRKFYTRLLQPDRVRAFSLSLLTADSPPRAFYEVSNCPYIFYSESQNGLIINDDPNAKFADPLFARGEASEVDSQEYNARMLCMQLANSIPWHFNDPGLLLSTLTQQAYVVDYVDHLEMLYTQSGDLTDHRSRVLVSVREQVVSNVANISTVIPSTVLALADHEGEPILKTTPRRLGSDEITRGIFQVATQGSFRLRYSSTASLERQDRRMACPMNGHIVRVYGSGVPAIYEHIKDYPGSKIAGLTPELLGVMNRLLDAPVTIMPTLDIDAVKQRLKGD